MPKLLKPSSYQFSVNSSTCFFSRILYGEQKKQPGIFTSSLEKMSACPASLKSQKLLGDRYCFVLDLWLVLHSLQHGE